MSTGGVINSLQTDWETPYEVIAWLDESYAFTMDLCASDQNRLCEKYYTRKNSCLKHDWHGEHCFMNPPYGKEMYPMLEKAVKTWKEGNCLIVAILPVRSDTNWFHDYVLTHSSLIILIRGRVKFDRAGSYALKGSGNPIGQMIVVWESEKAGDWELQRQVISSVSYKYLEAKYLKAGV